MLDVRTMSVKSKPKRRGYTSAAPARGRRRSSSSQQEDAIELFGRAWRSSSNADRKPKPTSPGRRFATYADFAELTKKEPEKSLFEGLNKSGGRNANGRITSRHRGGGAKRSTA